MNVLEKAEREIADGNLWRAKEILHRDVGHSGYRTDVFEKLGLVLLEMRDLSDAGKYLFLSGARKPEYEEAISLFLEKYEKKPQNLFASFPHSAKLSRISDYPSTVADKFRELGFPEILKDENGGQVNLYKDGGEKASVIIFLSVVLIILGLIILGIVKLIEIIF